MMVVVLVGVQGSSVLLYVYEIEPSEMIGHKLWFPNGVRLEGQNTWGFLNFEVKGIFKAILEKERIHDTYMFKTLIEHSQF